jgi:hypothetical protein
VTARDKSTGDRRTGGTSIDGAVGGVAPQRQQRFTTPINSSPQLGQFTFMPPLWAGVLRLVDTEQR